MTIKGASPDILALANEFLDTNINLSEPSRGVRREQLNHFFAYFKGEVLNVNQVQFNEFIGYLRHTRKFRSETIGGIKTASIGFLRFLHNKGMREEVEFRLQRIPRDQSRATAFSFNQYIQIVERAADLKWGMFNHWPSACIIGWNTGLRISDVIHLKWESVDFEQNVLRVKPKKLSRVNQELTIPMMAELREHLKFLWENRDPNHIYVLNSMAWSADNCRRRLTYNFTDLMKALGFNGYSFKSFRHAFVTRLLNAGVDAFVIGSMTGQAVETVYRYSRHVSISAKVNALNKASEALRMANEVAMEIELPN